MLAGVFLVGLVWQADRLARRRARFAASSAVVSPVTPPPTTRMLLSRGSSGVNGSSRPIF